MASAATVHASTDDSSASASTVTGTDRESPESSPTPAETQHTTDAAEDNTGAQDTKDTEAQDAEAQQAADDVAGDAADDLDDANDAEAANTDVADTPDDSEDGGDLDRTKAATPAAAPAGTRASSGNTVVTLDAADDEGVVDPTPTDTVDVALDQITEAREDLKEATWDSGNILAGLAAMLPQMWLGGAYASLERWQLNHAALQEQFAASVDRPFTHWIAGQRIEASIMRTIRAQDQLEAAEKWLGVVGLFGPREEAAAIAALINQAADNALVYQILDVYLEDFNGVRRVSPIISLSINGGDPVNVLLDTGSLGLVINPQVIGLKNIGDAIGSGTGCYADCSTPYKYDVYNIPISLGDIESTRTPVLVVTLDTWGALSETNGDYEGILGVGPNSGGAGTSTPLGALPGLLSQGVMLDYRRNRAILGPNPYAPRVVLAGAPSNNLLVKVGDNDAQVIDTWIDSGGLVGVIPSSVVGGANTIPNGTLISVYTADGETLLFSYRTRGNNTPSVDDNYEFVLMGSEPFTQMPIYTSFVTGEMALNYR